MLASLADRRGARLAAVLAIVLHAAAGQAQSSEEQYRRMVDDAVREFSAEHWEEARALFKRAHDLSPNARTLRGMGMTAFELRMYVQAMRELNGALAEKNKPLSPDMRAAVEQLIAKAHEFVGKVTLVSRAAQCQAARRRQGAAARTRRQRAARCRRARGQRDARRLQADEPPHQRRGRRRADGARADGAAARDRRGPCAGSLRRTEDRAAAGPARAHVGACRAPACAAPAKEKAAGNGSNLDTFAWIALAAGGAFGVTSGVFWLIGDSKVDKLEKECGNTCLDAEIEASGVKRMDTLTNVFLVATGVAAVTSGVLFGIYAGSSDEEEPEGLALDVGPGGVRVRGSF